uniref:Uncharacterized protein n=1 Tax=Meloidogyne enterolobii TaxID=390850 RepID=A0A6V7TXC1_MELEN|nr:unnamed protein product [Meloidogyne enterolobii]
MLFFPTKLFKKLKSFFSYLKLFAFKYFHIISLDYAEGNDQLFKEFSRWKVFGGNIKNINL